MRIDYGQEGVAGVDGYNGVSDIGGARLQWGKG